MRLSCPSRSPHPSRGSLRTRPIVTVTLLCTLPSSILSNAQQLSKYFSSKRKYLAYLKINFRIIELCNRKKPQGSYRPIVTEKGKVRAREVDGLSNTAHKASGQHGLLRELTEARVRGGLGLRARGAHLPWGSSAECQVGA